MAGAVTTKEEENDGVVGGAASGFLEFESGVEGDGADVPPASSSPTSSLFSEDSVRGLALRIVCSELDRNDPPVSVSAQCGDFAVGVVACPFTLGLKSGCSNTRPLLIPLPVMLLSPSPRLSRVDALPDVFSAVGAATEEASTRGSDDTAGSWSVLLPTFIILDSVDFRLDNGGMGAYSCADGMGGGKKGDPGDGKGEEDSLLTVTVSKGVSDERSEGGRLLVAMREWTAFEHRPVVSGVMTAEVIS